MLTDKNQRHVLLSNMVLLNHADAIYKIFKTEKIDVLFIKGAAFLDTLYEDLGKRSMCDIDILVKRSDKKKAVETLVKGGYRHIEVPENRRKTFDSHYNTPFYKKGMPSLILELHTELCQKHRFSINYNEFFDRSVLYFKNKRDIPTLSPEDSVLSLVLHACKESFLQDSLRIEDCRQIFKQWSPNIGVILAHAKKYKMFLATFYYLKLIDIDELKYEDFWKTELSVMEKSRLSLLNQFSMTPDIFFNTHRMRQLITMMLVDDDVVSLLKFFGKYSVRRFSDFKHANNIMKKISL